MIMTISLRPDCGRCAALCCVALAFDRSELFGLDKAAGQPCTHLAACGGCSIYHHRAQAGFGGCIAFDCLGAGQRVTQQIFKGRSWLDDRSLIDPMVAAFLAIRSAHEALLLLRQAARLPLSQEDRDRLVALEAALEAAQTPVAVAPLVAEVQCVLRSLRRYVKDSASENERATITVGPALIARSSPAV